MGERKAVNKYYPPDWTPEQGSLDRYHGQHPLRERARKLNQGILIIRFEMPYNIWCGGCGIHIGMGVRYNAEKKKVGNYYTTPIYRFRMKCHLCDNHFEIETDPKNCDYVIVTGARRKEERWDPSATETVELTDREDAKKMATDPMFKLEHGVKDQQKSKEVQPTLGQLQEVQSVWKDDYSLNQLLRKKFREQKHELKAQEMKDNELKERGALDLSLVPERLEDIQLAKKIRYHGEGFDEHRRKRRFEVNSRPMFDSKEKLDKKRERIKQLIGKRKQMQLSSFSSPPKDNEDSLKLGIKVRRNRSGSTDGLANKDSGQFEDHACRVSRGDSDACEEDPLPKVDNSRTEEGFRDASLTPRTLQAKENFTTGPSFPAGKEVKTPPLAQREQDDSTSFSSRQKKDHSGDSHLAENHKATDVNWSPKAKSDDFVHKNSRMGSLVCCDYSDSSSDGSDDPS